MSDEAGKPRKEPAISYRTPIYLQVRELVRSKIEDGEYLPGTAIPSENELAETYGINRITVRNAVDTLVNEGMLFRVQGKGVFVVGNKMEQSMEELGGFVPSLQQGGKEVSVRERSKVLRPAGDKYAEVFGIGPDELIYFIRQLLLYRGEVVSLEELYVPQNIVPQLDAVNSSVFSLQDIFAFYGVQVTEVRQSLEIVEVDAKRASALCLPPGVAVMRMETIRQEASGRVVEFNCMYTRSDKVNFSVQMDGAHRSGR